MPADYSRDRACLGAFKLYHRHTMRVDIPSRPADTSVEAERVHIDLLRAAPVARRLSLAWSLSATVIGAARRALARARPSASPRELDVWFVELHYGPELAAAVRDECARREHGEPARP